MYVHATIVLIAMIATFAISSWKLKSTELSMVITAIVGALVGGFGFPARLLVEGMFTFFDVGMTFITAAIFINIYSATGAMDAIVRAIVQNFHSKKWVVFVLLGCIMLIPGALTGAGSVSIFVVGGMVSTVLGYMGLSKKKVVGFVFMFAVLSAACPPINLWAMLMCAQANMPYVGFDIPLLAPLVVIATFTVIFFGWGSKAHDKQKILDQLPEPAEGMNWIRISLPLISLVVLFILQRFLAFYLPVIGLPLTFMICALISILCSPKRKGIKSWFSTINVTMEQVFPLLATVISVGTLVNIMTATGVRGLIAITFVTLPVVLIYVTALFFLPFAQGSLSYGSAVILGTPIIFLFNAIGVNVTIVAAALSFMFPLGDAMPPSRIVGRVAISTVEYEGSYMSFLKSIMIPAAFMGGVALLMLILANKFSFLVVY